MPTFFCCEGTVNLLFFLEGGGDLASSLKTTNPKIYDNGKSVDSIVFDRRNARSEGKIYHKVIFYLLQQRK